VNIILTPEEKQNYDHVHAIYDHVGSQQVVY